MCARGLLKTKCVCICVLEVRSGGGRMRRRRKHLDGWTHSSFQHPSCAIGPKPAGGIPLFLSSGPLRFVDDWISAGLNQPVALLNLAWPITPAGNMAQSMLQLTILVSVDFSCLCLRGGDAGSDIFSGSVIAEGWALLHCLVPFCVCQVTFLWVTVRCYKSLMGLCAAASAEGENPLPSVHTSVSDTAAVDIAAVVFFKKFPSVQLPAFPLPLLHPQRAGLKTLKSLLLGRKEEG